MTDYIMPIKAIKSILRKELESHYQTAYSKLNQDVQWEYLRIGNKLATERLEMCQDYDSLDDFIHRFYRMSLREWIESL